MSDAAQVQPLHSAENATDAFWENTISGWKDAMNTLARQVEIDPDNRVDYLEEMESLITLARSFPGDR